MRRQFVPAALETSVFAVKIVSLLYYFSLDGSHIWNIFRSLSSKIVQYGARNKQSPKQRQPFWQRNQSALSVLLGSQGVEDGYLN